MSNAISARMLSFLKATSPFILYATLSLVAHTLLNTIVTFQVSQTPKTGTEYSNAVNEIADQYLFFSYGLAALLLTLTLWQADRALYRASPFWNDLRKPFWQLDRSRKEELLRGLSSGTLAAVVFLLFFTMSKQLGYLDVYITSTIGTPIFPQFFMDVAALVTLLLCEEFLFRHKILRGLLTLMPESAAILITSALHILTRHWQFHLREFDYINLACLNLVLGYFYVKSGKCHRGLGFLVALLLLLHNAAGLPLWGYESPSIFLFKAGLRSSSLVTGGVSGPLGGLGLFGILAIFALGSFLTWKRELEAKRQARGRSP